jgi:hypothetical protein
MSIFSPSYSSADDTLVITVRPPLIAKRLERPTDRSKYVPHCRPQTNVVAVKVHKCASSTVSNIIIRHGMKHNLVFGLPRHDEAHIGWPMALQPERDIRDFKTIRNRNITINAIAHHLVFDGTLLKTIMPKNTSYFAIIRRPLGQFISTLNFFKADIRRLHIPGNTTQNKAKEFLSNPLKYEKTLKISSLNKRVVGPKSITKNFMSTDLGLRDKNIDGDAELFQFARDLDRDLTLMLIQEYFDESLVLMKRLLCWELHEFLNLQVNVRTNYVRKEDPVMARQHASWSKADHTIYNYFNTTFWGKVREQGPDFFDEVEHLKKLNVFVQELCALYVSTDKFNKITNPPEPRTIILPESRWNSKVYFRSSDCYDIAKRPFQFKELFVRHKYMVSHQRRI